jgi:hypothetical protein
MTSTFDPLKTREEQGLEQTPAWLFSVAKQRKMLKLSGLRESAPNADGWTGLERIPPQPMFALPKGSRFDNPYGADEKAVTDREQSKYLAHFAAARKIIAVDYEVRV